MSGNPLQPARRQIGFAAHLAVSATNVTGNNTTYTIINWTEDFDFGSCFNPVTGVFTAPVTGLYLLTGTVTIQDLGATNEVVIRFVLTGLDQFGYFGGPVASGGAFRNASSAIAYMLAGETATLTITCNGAGADTVDVTGNATNSVTAFGASLLNY